MRGSQALISAHRLHRFTRIPKNRDNQKSFMVSLKSTYTINASNRNVPTCWVLSMNFSDGARPAIISYSSMIT